MKDAEDGKRFDAKYVGCTNRHLYSLGLKLRQLCDKSKVRSRYTEINISACENIVFLLRRSMCRVMYKYNTIHTLRAL